MCGIYIHIPFCERKCFYCDFYSIDNSELIEEYIVYLQKEIYLKSLSYNDYIIDTIYFGGGTPSLLSPFQIEKIIKSLNNNFKFSTDLEVTIECNPNSITKEKLEGFKNIGINRISLGVQSFLDNELNFLKRLHSSKDSRLAIENIINTGFDNFSVDLIYGIPDSSIDDLEYNLYELQKYNPKHISAYNLIFEENTPLYFEYTSGNIQKIPESLEEEMYFFVMTYLENNGYHHYEVSNYSRKGFESKHNSKYWDHSPYLGFGPSAHSYINYERLSNYSDLKKYIIDLKRGLLPTSLKETIDNKKLYEEMIFLGLRSSGIKVDLINNLFNIDFLIEKKNIISDLIENGFITLNNNLIKLTKKGFLLCDEICLKLI